ncbi:GNAT family N-acetyltransferase [Dongshaea marina]|uniref:GNAT family N-acetyltransferase n=1 Tax=Dongshaea marina TaxID=2047966 RepID=UPI00131EFD8D|nr:GNAT family N-acetyltransferase [Dongshaea marina]
MIEQPTLTSSRLLLRPFCLADAPRVKLYAGDIRIASVSGSIPHPYLDGMAETWISAHQPGWKKKRLAAYALCLRETPEEIIGAISLFDIEGGEAELGYWVGVPFWGKGYCTEAALVVIKFGFEKLSLTRIHSRHKVRNPASGRVMQKAGLQPAAYPGREADEPMEYYELVKPQAVPA